MPPVDVRAAVISNVRLSSDYNVLTLEAPQVGALTEPGQFVMLKTTERTDPMLRRPFSVFEVLRDDLGDGARHQRVEQARRAHDRTALRPRGR